MKSNPLNFIKTRHSLRRKERSHVIKKIIVDKIQNDIDTTKLRSNGCIDLELITFIASCCEELCKPKYNINKKEFVCEILNVIFNNALSQNELKEIEKQIDFIHENGLICKVEIALKLRMIVWDWIKRKFL